MSAIIRRRINMWIEDLKHVDETNLTAEAERLFKTSNRGGEGVTVDEATSTIEVREKNAKFTLRKPNGHWVGEVGVAEQQASRPVGGSTETVDILTDPASPKLPDGCLPQILQSWVDEVHADNHFDKAALALAMIAVASMIAHKGTVLRVKQGWEIRAIIWGNLVGVSGDKKTPIFKTALWYAERLQNELDDDRRREIARAIEEQELEGDEATKFAKEYPAVRSLTENDATTEALMELLAAEAQKDSGVGVFRDELAGLMGGMNAYRSGRGADRQLFLEFYNGGRQKKRRVSKGATHEAKNAAVAILGGTQHSALHDICQKAVDDGWMQRWLYVVIGEQPFRPIIFDDDERAVPHHQRRIMLARLRGVRDAGPKTFHLTKTGQQILSGLLEKYDPMKKRGTAISSWYGKIADHWGRVATIFQLLDDETATNISDRNALAAEKIVEELFIPSAEAAFMIMEKGVDLRLRRAAEAVLRAAANGEYQIDTRKLKSSVRQLHGATVFEIERIMSPLEGANWITPIFHDPKTPGRKPPKAWWITPNLVEKYEHHLNSALELTREVQRKMAGEPLEDEE